MRSSINKFSIKLLSDIFPHTYRTANIWSEKIVLWCFPSLINEFPLSLLRLSSASGTSAVAIDNKIEQAMVSKQDIFIHLNIPTLREVKSRKFLRPEWTLNQSQNSTRMSRRRKIMSWRQIPTPWRPTWMDRIISHKVHTLCSARVWSIKINEVKSNFNRCVALKIAKRERMFSIA